MIIEGGVLIDGTGREPIKNTNIVITGSRITTIGRKNAISKGKFVEAEDKCIIPGLIDCHVHFTMSSRLIRGINASLVQPLPITVLESVKRLKLTLEAGFTTIKDCGAIDHIDIALKQAIKMNLIPGPRIICCGRALAITGGHCVTYLPEFGNMPLPHSATREVDGSNDAIKAAREEIKAGADWIKLMHGGTHAFGTRAEEPVGGSQFTIDEMKAVCNAVHTLGRRVCAHTFSARSVKNSVLSGVDMIEHGLFIDEEGAKMMRERDVALSSHLALMKLRKKVGLEKLISQGYSEEVARKIALEDPDFSYENIMKHLMSAVRAGVKIIPGTDFSGARLGDNALELQCLVEMGLTPMQALLVATKNAAEALGIEAGTIEPGKIADLVIVDGNPLEDIALLQDKTKISMVIKEGAVIIERP